MALKAEDALAIAMKYTDEHGGGGGTSDYTSLKNKPQINNVTLTGNKTTEDLIPIGNGLNFNEDGELEVTGSETTYDDLQGKPKINNVELSGNKTSTDLGLMSEYDIDDTPTESSENLITSGAVWNADKSIKDKLQGSKQVSSTGGTIEIPDYGITESIEMYFKPTQDLHGYDKPWAGGAYINKMPPGESKSTSNYGVTITSDENGVYTFIGTCTQDFEVTFDCDDFTIPSADNSAFYLFNTEANADTVFVFYNGSSVIDVWSLNSVNKVSTYTGMKGLPCNKYGMRLKNGVTYNLIIKPMLAVGTSYTSFEPYSNICPISGQNNATFEWTGKNKVKSISDNPSTSQYATILYIDIDFEPSTTYTLSFEGTGGNHLYTNENLAVEPVFFEVESSGRTIVTFTTKDSLPSAEHISAGWAFLKNAENIPLPNTFNDMMIEVGSTATSYEPYTKGEVAMNFGDTYYGGYCQFDGDIYSDWDYISSYNGETLSGEWVSDRDEYQAGTTPTIGAEVAYKTTPSYVRVTPPANLNLTDDYPIEYNGYMASIDYQPKNTVLAEAKKYTNQEIVKLGLPKPPTTDGTYHLECSVSGGVPTIRWVVNSEE